MSAQTDRIETWRRLFPDKTSIGNKYDIEFDLSLVRARYYTGTVFVIECKDFNSSVAGGVDTIILFRIHQ